MRRSVVCCCWRVTLVPWLLLGLAAPQEDGSKKCSSNLDCTAPAKIGLCITGARAVPFCIFLTPSPLAEVNALQHFAQANPSARQPGGCLEHWEGGDPCVSPTGASATVNDLDDFVDFMTSAKGKWRWPGVQCCKNSADFKNSADLLAIFGADAAGQYHHACPRGAGVIKLDLSSCSLVWSDSLMALSLLRELQLDGNRITYLPAGLSSLPDLTQLSFKDNLVSNISPGFGQASNLITLELSGNRIRTLPTSLGNLTQLTTLNLARNQLFTVPSCFARLSALQRLYLQYNQLQILSLPDGIFGSLTQLYHLDLSFNALTSLPADFDQLSSLKFLFLNDNRLDYLRDNVFAQFRTLEELHLQNNELVRLPALEGLLNVAFVSASNNTIGLLPPLLPRQLTHLYLGGNPINASATVLTNYFGGPARGVGWVDLSASPQLPYFTHGHPCSRHFGHPADIKGKDKCVVQIDIDSGAAIGTTRRRSAVTMDKHIGLVCRVGEPCAFTIHLQDQEGFPVRHGGANLTMSLQGLTEQATFPLVDSNDGTYRGDLPRDWLRHVSDRKFNASAPSQFITLKRWQAGVAMPFYASTTTSLQPLCSDADNFYTCPLQLFVQPPDCKRQIGALGQVDPHDKSVCRCQTGSFLANSEILGTSGHGRCIAHCPTNQQRGKVGDGHGDTCLCMKGTYNSTRFPLRVLPGGNVGCTIDFTPNAHTADIDSGLVCKTCPTMCTRCDSHTGDGFDGVPTIKEGWRVVRGGHNCSTRSSGRLECSAALNSSVEQISIFQCDEHGGNLSHPACPSYSLDRPCPPCAHQHVGLLCGSCVHNFARSGVNCRRCEGRAAPLLDSFNPWKRICALVVSAVVFIYIVSLWRDWTAVVCVITTTSFLLAVITVSFLVWLVADMFGITIMLVSLVLALSVAVVAQNSKMLKNIIWCNVRIMIGQMQVLSLLYASLDVNFPPPFTKAAEYIGLFSIDTARLVTVLELQCVDELDFYTRWLFQVLGVPLIAATFTLLCFGYNKSMAHYATPWLYSARQGLDRAMQYALCNNQSVQLQQHWMDFNTLDRDPDGLYRNTDSSQQTSINSSTGQISNIPRYSHNDTKNKLYRMGFRDAEDALEEVGTNDEQLNAAGKENRFKQAFDILRNKRAATRWKQLTSLWIFILYAPTSSAIVKIFQCRQLGATLSVLVEDSQIHCCDNQYQRYRILAWILVILVPLGVPAIIVYWMWKNLRKNRVVACMETLVATRFAEARQLGANEDVTSQTRLEIEDSEHALDSGVQNPSSGIRLPRASVERLRSQICVDVFGEGGESAATLQLQADMHSCTVRSLSLRLIARASAPRLEMVRTKHKAMSTEDVSIDRPRGCFGPVDRLPGGATPDLIQIIRDPSNPFNMKHFDSFLDDYRDGLFWFEPFDLVRKLALTALPRVVGRGSASQRLLMGCMSLVFLGLQVHWSPYKDARSNVLKIGVEANIFLLVAIASWIRSDQQIYFGGASQVYVAVVFWSFTGLMVALSCLDILLRCCEHYRSSSAKRKAEVQDAGGVSPAILSETTSLSLGAGSWQPTSDHGQDQSGFTCMTESPVNHRH